MQIFCILTFGAADPGEGHWLYLGNGGFREKNLNEADLVKSVHKLGAKPPYLAHDRNQ